MEFAVLLAVLVIAVLILGIVVLMLRWIVGEVVSRRPSDKLPDLRGRSTPQVHGEAAIRVACNELRAGQPQRIDGVWCSKHSKAEIIEYFENESAELRNNPNLEIRRLVNPAAVGQEAWDEFENLWLASPENTRWQVRINVEDLWEFESFAVDYGTKEAVAVWVVNDVGPTQPEPSVGYILDPNKDPSLKPEVNAVMGWFERIYRRSEPINRPEISRWDQAAKAYDNEVWLNDDLPTFFTDYRREEHVALAKVLSEEAARGEQIAIVEVGCGTGRTLMQCIDGAFSPSLLYLIGFDYSFGMIREADRRITQDMVRFEEKKELLRRTSLLRLRAERMGVHFHNGTLQNSNDATWYPQGVEPVDPTAFANCRKVFCCMLNTLGVIPDEQRQLVLENMLLALGEGDRLVISVLDAIDFDSGALSFYSKIPGVTGARSAASMKFHRDAVFEVVGQPGYFSRWFHASPDSSGVADEYTIEGMLAMAKRSIANRMSVEYDVTSTTGGIVVVLTRTS